MSTESKNRNDSSECKIDDDADDDNKTLYSIIHDISNFKNLSDKTLRQINTKMSSKDRILVLKRFNEVVNYLIGVVDDSDTWSTK
jgi:hypothetical protein